MALRQLLSERQAILDHNGAPLAAGLVYFFLPGTSTPVTTYTDSGLVNANTNPVVLSGAGRATAWAGQDCDMRVTDPQGGLITFETNVNPDTVDSGESGGLLPNGSFETDTDADLIPDGWTENVYTGGTVRITTNAGDQTDGFNGMEFISAGANGGGDIETSAFFTVNDVDDLRVEFDLKASAASGLPVIARIKWFDVSQVSISNTDAYTTSTNPTSWTTIQTVNAPPAGARFAKLQLIGIDPTGAGAGTVWIDRAKAFYPAVVAGVFDNITIQANDIISTNLNGDINLIPDGTGRIQAQKDINLASGQVLRENGNTILGVVSNNTEISRLSVNQLRLIGGGITELLSAGNTDLEQRYLKFAHQDGTERAAIGQWTAADTLYLHNSVAGAQVLIAGTPTLGGYVNMFYGDPDAESRLYHAGQRTILTDQYGARLRGTTLQAGDLRVWLNDELGADLAYLRVSRGSHWEIRGLENSSLGILRATDSLGADQKIFQGSGDNYAYLYYAGVERLRTHPSQGAQVDKGSGWEEVAVLSSSITGNAATATLAAEATILETPRQIGGVNFDGSTNITPALIQTIVTTDTDTTMYPMLSNGSGAADRQPQVTTDFRWNDSTKQLDLNGSIILLSGTSINEFSTDGLLGGNSDNAVPTEQAIREYLAVFGNYAQGEVTSGNTVTTDAETRIGLDSMSEVGSVFTVDAALDRITNNSGDNLYCEVRLELTAIISSARDVAFRIKESGVTIGEDTVIRLTSDDKMVIVTRRFVFNDGNHIDCYWDSLAVGGAFMTLNDGGQLSIKVLNRNVS